MSLVPSPKNFIPLIVSGSNQSIKNQHATSVIKIDIKLPVFNDAWTCASLASLFLIFINSVPIIDAIIPTPAMNKGNSIGPIPLKASEYWLAP